MQTPHLDARFSSSVLAQPRVGLIVPRHKQSAVDRNRLRRRLRELIRIALLPNVTRGDALIRAKADAYDVSFADLRTEIDSIGRWISGLETPR